MADRSYLFARKPRWIVLHVLVLLAVPIFAVAGTWQLSRLAERQERNRSIREAFRAEPVDLNQMLLVSGRRPQRAVAEGRYDVAREVRVLNRTYEGRAGVHLVTPLVIEDGTSVLVDRGFIAADVDPRSARPPRGEVRVEGILYRDEPKRPLAPDDPPRGKLEAVGRIVPSRLQEQLPYQVQPMFLRLTKQTPGNTGPWPIVAPRPPLDEGPHRAYAIQWFLFIPTLIAVYVALLRRQARQEAQTRSGEGEGANSNTPASRLR